MPVNTSEKDDVANNCTFVYILTQNDNSICVVLWQQNNTLR